MPRYATPFRVGLFVLAAGVSLFFILSFARKGGLSAGERKTVHAYFHDASGLSRKSRVQIAGIAVGEISQIALEGTRAKVTLRIRKEVDLRTDAALTKRSESLLGDYLLDLSPGSDRAPPMPEEGEVTRVIDSQGMDKVFGSLEGITKDIKSVTESLSDVLGGSRGAGSLQRILEALLRLSEATDLAVRESGRQLTEVLRNFEGISSDVREVTEGQQRSVERIVGNLQVITQDLREVLGSVKDAVGGNGQPGTEGEGAAASLKQSLQRLDRTLANAEEISRKVKDGDGIAGKLLGDDRLAQQLEETIQDVSGLTSRLTHLKTDVTVKSEYLFGQGRAKTAVSLRLVPKPDKYYLVELVDDPRGNVETVVFRQTPPVEGEPQTQVQQWTRETLKFSAQYARRYGFATLRFGVIESTGGLGLDLSAFDDLFILKFDAFDFSIGEGRLPRLRTALRFAPSSHLFATVGLDDFLNPFVRGPEGVVPGRDFFVGVGVYFTDDDLKSVFALVPLVAP